MDAAFKKHLRGDKAKSRSELDYKMFQYPREHAQSKIACAMKKNIVANFIGRFWSSLSNFIFLPLYIQILGFDNYAIISFGLIVAGVLLILDVGLSASASRELARSDTTNGEKYGAFHTLEKFYVLIFTICIVAGLFLSGPIANNFINSTPIDRDLIGLCLKIIAVEAGFQIVFRFYIGAMMGLEKQVQANLFNIAWGIIRNGLVIVVILIWPTLLGFFIWQMAATFLIMFVAKIKIERQLVAWKPDQISFIDIGSLRRIRAFATGIFLVSLVAAVNTQVDKITLSHLISLEFLGYYNIAVAIGAGMLALSSPFLASIQPRLTKYFSENRHDDARELYSKIATIVVILVFPLMATIGFHAETVVIAWTGNPIIAEQSAAIIPWVVVAYAMLAVSSMSYGVALANGFTLYNNILGLLSLLVSIPGYWLMVERFGVIGAAALFMAIQLTSSIILQILIDRKFLRLGIIRSLMQFYICPIFVAVSIASFLQWQFNAPADSRILMLLYLGTCYILTVAGTAGLITLLFRVKWQTSNFLPEEEN